MSARPGGLPPRIDPFTLDLAGNPYGDYARLRDAGPLLRGGPATWVVPRHREVNALLRDPRLGQFRFIDAGTGGTAPRVGAVGAHVGSWLRNVLVSVDGTEHTRLRGVLRDAMATAASGDLEGYVEGLVDELLRPLAGGQTVEVVSQLARPVPLRVFARLFGLSRDEVDTVAPWVLRLSTIFAPAVDADGRAAADEAVIHLRQYLKELYERRLRRPSDDVISSLVASARKGQLKCREAIDNAIFLMFAGLQTSASLICSGCVALARQPEQMERLAAEPGLVPTAVEEFLRFDAPTQITGRIVLEPLELAGRMLRPGRVVLLLLGSANHDEAVFSEPGRVDVARDPNPHVTFGTGPHSCLGAHLARKEARILFRRIVRTLRRIELVGEPTLKASATARTHATVFARVHPL